MTALCVPLEGLSRADLALAGGKGANLGELTRAGFAVPRGFVVTTEAYRRATARLAAPTSAQVATLPVPEDVADAVLAGYERLGTGPVAVRSSATAEDLPGAAFAGQQDTYLNVVGTRSVVEAVRDCWASLWTDRAIAYRARLGIPDDDVAIAVVVQEMVLPDWAGVMFTAHPVTGARDHVVIDSSPGLGESVVSGAVTPDHVVLGPDDRVLERRAGRPESIVRAAAAGGTETVAGDVDIPPLTEPELRQLAATGRRIARHFGSPQDIEWAITGPNIWITQARPMTALPPPPVPLNRIQRTIGPVVNELLPRRPLPMELTAWVTGPILGHVERMLGGMAGVSIDAGAVLPTDDGIVQSFVPPTPRPTALTPIRLARSLVRSVRHDARSWQSDPLTVAIRADAARLAASEVTSADWGDLLAVRERATSVTDRVADLRARYLPGTARALLTLAAALAVTGRRRALAGLIGGAETQTMQANRALATLADTVRVEPGLRHAFETTRAADLPRLVESSPDGAALREGLERFRARFGHRETTGLMLLRDPGWGEAPEVVLGLVQALLAPSSVGAAGEAEQPTPHAPLPWWLPGVVATAREGVGFREDTHFELTRVMPIVRHTVVELGSRLAVAGAIGHPDDIWYLLWDEVAGLPNAAAGARDDHLRNAVARRRAAYAALASAPLIATTTLYPNRAAPSDALLSGIPGGGGRGSGPVRIVHGPDEFALLRPGEVLVCAATNPSWTPLFARAGALVVDNGGPASHAAIVAREYGLPAVLGAADATGRLTPGQQVIVDGDHGLVLPADDPEAAGHG